MRNAHLTLGGPARQGTSSTSLRDGDMDHAAIVKRLSGVRPEDGLIPTFVHGDPEIHRLELERVFRRNWLLVAHESEIAGPGDFVARSMGEQPVIVTRTRKGEVHVLLNVCPHRAMRLCSEDAGTKQVFRCPYHGFTFSGDGRLSGAPFSKDAYPDGLDRDRLRLREARVETYKGLIFATWDHHAEPLSAFLGNVAWYLDIVVGRAEMEVVGPPQKFVVPAAWKIPCENFIADAYHTVTAHAFLNKLKLTDGADFGKDGFHVMPDDGHGVGIGIQEDGPWYPEELAAEIQDHLSVEQLALLDQVKNFVGHVYPNFSFLMPNVIDVHGRRVTGTTLRQWQPLGPDKITVTSWLLVERNAPEVWKNLVRRAHLLTFGASGMLEQDDTEIWEAITQNAVTLQAQSDPWYLDYTMGLTGKPLEDFAGPGTPFAGKFTEVSARGFYRRWVADMMKGEDE